jgi:hypothetical protein
MSSGPAVATCVFQRFKHAWTASDQARFEAETENLLMSTALKDASDTKCVSIVTFLRFGCFERSIVFHLTAQGAT